MKNEFVIRNGVVYIIIKSPKYGTIETAISTQDLERACEFPNTWRVRWDKGTRSFYVRGHSRNDEGKRITELLHRWILRLDNSKLHVDHINHDTLDNTRGNLRIVTIAENAQNLRLKPNNTSGFTGVSWNKREKKWKSYIKVNGENKYLGSYKDIETAVRKRKEAEERYFKYKRSIG